MVSGPHWRGFRCASEACFKLGPDTPRPYELGISCRFAVSFTPRKAP